MAVDKENTEEVKEIEPMMKEWLRQVEEWLRQEVGRRCSLAMLASGLLSSVEILIFEETQKGRCDSSELDEEIIDRLLTFMKNSECPFCAGDNKRRKGAAEIVLEFMNFQEDILGDSSPKAFELTKKALNQYIKSYT